MNALTPQLQASSSLTTLAGADAELIAIDREAAPLIAEYRRVTDMFFSLPAKDPEAQKCADLGDAPYERLDELIDQTLDLPATTPQGFVAKARLLKHALLMYRGDRGVFTPHGDEDDLAWSLANDILGAPDTTLTVSPDAGLLAACTECAALQREIDAHWDKRTPDDLTDDAVAEFEDARQAALDPLEERMEPLLTLICDLRATTREGQVARAKTLLGWDKDPCWTKDGCWNSHLIGAIVRDLVGEA